MLNTIIGEGKHKQYLSFADSLLTSEHTPPELLAAFLHERFKNELVMDKYINLPANDTFVHPEMHDHSQVYIALGYDAGYNKRKLLDLIFKRSGVGCERLGKWNAPGRILWSMPPPETRNESSRRFRAKKTPKPELRGWRFRTTPSAKTKEQRASRNDVPPNGVSPASAKTLFTVSAVPIKGKKPRYAKWHDA
ncbi:MAG: hypothetical protein V8T87_16960 [Victivallales bacterium]